MYLSNLADEIRSRVPPDRIPPEKADELFMTYALLARAKGIAVTESDVHDAWSAWMQQEDPEHPALVPYTDLDPETAAQDSIFATAIIDTALARDTKGIETVLFPRGRQLESSNEFFELYKLMVSSSESLVSRRQGVNTFFITVNGALLTALSLLAGHVVSTPLGAIGVGLLSLSGLLLALAWRSLIVSFGQLNRGKFRVINTMERYLDAAIYAAEWEALGRGKNPKVYRSFTSREVWVPNTLAAVYVVAIVASVLVGCGLLNLN